MAAYKTGADLVNEAMSRVTEIAPEAAVAAHAAHDANTVFLDVRETNEWNLGRVPGAIHIPRGQLEGKVEGLVDRGRRVFIYCAAGSRAALAADTMQQMGYGQVVSVAGGFRGWVEAGGEIED